MTTGHKLSASFNKENNFVTSRLHSCTPSESGLLLKESKLFPFRLTPFQKGVKTILTELSSL